MAFPSAALLFSAAVVSVAAAPGQGCVASFLSTNHVSIQWHALQSMSTHWGISCNGNLRSSGTEMSEETGHMFTGTILQRSDRTCFMTWAFGTSSSAMEPEHCAKCPESYMNSTATALCFGAVTETEECKGQRLFPTYSGTMKVGSEDLEAYSNGEVTILVEVKQCLGVAAYGPGGANLTLVHDIVYGGPVPEGAFEVPEACEHMEDFLAVKSPFPEEGRGLFSWYAGL